MRAYPFVNGGDNRDLGLNPLLINFKPCFMVRGIPPILKRFYRPWKNKGATVLVHPIRGRLPEYAFYVGIFPS